jgi:hypothetical protein
MNIQPELKELTYPERCRIYASEEWEFMLDVSKYAKRVARVVNRDMKLDPVVVAMLKQIHELEVAYRADHSEDLTPSAYSLYNRTVLYRSNLKLLESQVYEIKKLHVKQKLVELVPEDLRETVACALRQMIGYAPSCRPVILLAPRKDDTGRYRKVALVSKDYDPDEEVSELLQEDQAIADSCAKTAKRRGKEGGKRKRAGELEFWEDEGKL